MPKASEKQISALITSLLMTRLGIEDISRLSD